MQQAALAQAQAQAQALLQQQQPRLEVQALPAQTFAVQQKQRSSSSLRGRPPWRQMAVPAQMGEAEEEICFVPDEARRSSWQT